MPAAPRIKQLRPDCIAARTSASSRTRPRTGERDLTAAFSRTRTAGTSVPRDGSTGACGPVAHPSRHRSRRRDPLPAQDRPQSRLHRQPERRSSRQHPHRCRHRYPSTEHPGQVVSCCQPSPSPGVAYRQCCQTSSCTTGAKVPGDRWCPQKTAVSVVASTQPIVERRRATLAVATRDPNATISSAARSASRRRRRQVCAERSPSSVR